MLSSVFPDNKKATNQTSVALSSTLVEVISVMQVVPAFKLRNLSGNANLQFD